MTVPATGSDTARDARAELPFGADVRLHIPVAHTLALLVTVGACCGWSRVVLHRGDEVISLGYMMPDVMRSIARSLVDAADVVEDVKAHIASTEL